MNADWIIPDWPAPAIVRGLSTTRRQGFSVGPWSSLNLGLNCADDPSTVWKNRELLRTCLPSEPHWLQQVHGTNIFLHPEDADERNSTGSGLQHTQSSSLPVADAQLSCRPEQVCVIQTADCLPVLFCNRSGTKVAAAHAGWRGLAEGVLERTVQAFAEPSGRLMAWLGPAIGPLAYTVQEDVRDIFMQKYENAGACFVRQGDHFRFDLYAMARHCLSLAGVVEVSGGQYCTYGEPDRFFSYRRDGMTGRMASLVWLEK